MCLAWVQQCMSVSSNKNFGKFTWYLIAEIDTSLGITMVFSLLSRLVTTWNPTHNEGIGVTFRVCRHMIAISTCVVPYVHRDCTMTIPCMTSEIRNFEQRSFTYRFQWCFTANITSWFPISRTPLKQGPQHLNILGMMKHGGKPCVDVCTRCLYSWIQISAMPTQERVRADISPAWARTHCRPISLNMVKVRHLNFQLIIFLINQLSSTAVMNGTRTITACVCIYMLLIATSCVVRLLKVPPSAHAPAWYHLNVKI